MLPKEIFLSHSSQDQTFAMQVAETLRQHGIPVWCSPSNLIGAQQWLDEIGTALERCDWFIVILSPHSIKSKWVKYEFNAAVLEDHFNEKIVPLRFAPCPEKELSWLLPQLQIVDFTVSHDEGFTQLLRVFGMGFKGLP